MRDKEMAHTVAFVSVNQIFCIITIITLARETNNKSLVF